MIAINPSIRFGSTKQFFSNTAGKMAYFLKPNKSLLVKLFPIILLLEVSWIVAAVLKELDTIRKAVITISDEIKSISEHIDDQNHQIKEISKEFTKLATASNTSEMEIKNLVSKSQ